MSFFQALILGLVQGLTEFFPVSSSAHLKLAKWFLNISDGEHLLYFDLLCHAGTLLALVIYLRKDVWSVLRSLRQIALYSLAIFPLVPAYFLLKPLRTWASDPTFLGYSLLFTAALLFLASRKRTPEFALSSAVSADEKSKLERPERGGWIYRWRKQPLNKRQPKWGHVLCIGLMQTLALIPGISRSGSTISAARFCGWDWKEAARFSFLLSIPTILGGELLETMRLMKGEILLPEIDLACYIGGFIASFGLGLLSVRWVFWIYEREKVQPFAWYCLCAGLFAWVALNG